MLIFSPEIIKNVCRYGTLKPGLKEKKKACFNSANKKKTIVDVQPVKENSSYRMMSAKKCRRNDRIRNSPFCCPCEITNKARIINGY